MRWRMLAAIGAAAVASGAGCGGRQRGGGPASCTEAAGGAARNLRAVRPEVSRADLDPAPDFAEICRKDAWDDPPRRCFRDAETPADARICAGLLTEPQRSRARTVQTQLLARASTALNANEHGSSTTGITECDEYLAAIDELIACDKTPQNVRDAVSQARASMGAGWAQLHDLVGSTYDAAREAAASGCSQAAEAISQSARAMGC